MCVICRPRCIGIYNIFHTKAKDYQCFQKFPHEDIQRERMPRFKKEPIRRSNIRRQDNNGRFMGNSQRNNKRRKWRNRGPKGRKRPVPPMSGGNRQPISSMRMRMDDYVSRSNRTVVSSKCKLDVDWQNLRRFSTCRK